MQSDQLPVAISQVGRLDQVADIKREAIAFILGRTAERIEVDVIAEITRG